jgi:uncharacterized membrane protein
MCGAASLLAGFLFYRAGRPGWCYAILMLGMLCHESSAISFLAIPFLYWDLNRENLRRFVLHALACFVSIGTILTIRALVMNEARTLALSSNLLATVDRMLVSLATGTRTHLRLLFERAFDSLQNRDRLWNAYVFCGESVFLIGVTAAMVWVVPTSQANVLQLRSETG